MKSRSEGVPAKERDTGLIVALRRFPCPIAIAQDDLAEALAIGWACVGSGGQTYAVSVTYDEPRLHRLTVKTVRRLPRVRHLPIESPQIQIMEYLGRADVIAHPEKYLRGGGPRDGTLDPGLKFVDDYGLARLPEHVTRIPVIVPLDDSTVTGYRIDNVEGCSLAALSWGTQTVYCTGTPADINSLRLRTATPDDYLRIR